MSSTHRTRWLGIAAGIAALGVTMSACGSTPSSGIAPTTGQQPAAQAGPTSSENTAGSAIKCTVEPSQQGSADQVAQCFYAASLQGNFRRASQYAFDPETPHNYPALAALQTAPVASRQARFTSCTPVTAIPGSQNALSPDNAPKRCEFPFPGGRVDVYVLEGAENTKLVYAVGFDGKPIPDTSNLPNINYNQGG
jgi:hypothetical protein